MFGTNDWAEQRGRMVKNQLKRRYIHDRAVLSAMGTIPRECFVPEHYQDSAYVDSPLPIPEGQTISQPYIVAYMLESLHLKPHYRVLEIGTGSGYAAAVLSQIVHEVYTIEWYHILVEYAQKRFTQLSLSNIYLHQGDGSTGWPEFAPYDGILVSAGGPKVPRILLDQLAIGGRLVIPVGQVPSRQELIGVIREDQTHFGRVNLGAVAFVPLRGQQGWGDDDLPLMAS